jgi:hypothetical protein
MDDQIVSSANGMFASFARYTLKEKEDRREGQWIAKATDFSSSMARTGGAQRLRIQKRPTTRPTAGERYLSGLWRYREPMSLFISRRQIESLTSLYQAFSAWQT